MGETLSGGSQSPPFPSSQVTLNSTDLSSSYSACDLEAGFGDKDFSSQGQNDPGKTYRISSYFVSILKQHFPTSYLINETSDFKADS